VAAEPIETADALAPEPPRPDRARDPSAGPGPLPGVEPLTVDEALGMRGSGWSAKPEESGEDGPSGG
jgi:hypothetical protein